MKNMTRQIKPLRFSVGVVVVFLVVIFLASTEGGRGFFSPDTLETKWQRERVLWFTHLPVYRSTFSYHRYELVEYLISKGYWTPLDVDEPRWMSVFHWNRQWKGGTGDIPRFLGWRGQRWIDWSEADPEAAKVMWPRVLDVLRSEDGNAMSRFAELMWEAERCSNLGEVNAKMRELKLLP